MVINMRISYDPDADVMDIKFQKGKYEISKEIGDGIIVDTTKEGKVISIEILDASKRISLKNIRDITVGMPIKATKIPMN